ncbi:DUF3243 domain-containing protein [Paenisporosarcina sp. FSL H8-0542]|uniref:DUF3243 domain-containing protein n=1 Tax=unclassified Paenisporosarcina TaxID=2642018 RepID=UPI00034E3811|nr:DUF3243 domain-containing protein [Paenisporosarcina sp. HGH0030]EPD51338.1 hypothetical protein HMPREF1210_01936 [Paenisporosarcina sp. HGH0030]
MENIQGKVQEELNNVSSEKKEEILANFSTFKSYLGDKVAMGEKLGLGEEQLAKTAEKVAGYLANNEEPRNSEENLLQELWKSGDKDQQHALAHMLVNMVRK